MFDSFRYLQVFTRAPRSLELYQYELQEIGKVSGAGGYGTLFPFVYGVLIGFPLSLLHIPPGETIVQLSGAWILASQLNLYRRVNELCTEDEDIRKVSLFDFACHSCKLL